MMKTTSIGRFAVYREFVNIENSPHDCAQDRQEDPQDGAQDRQEEPQGDHFFAKMVFKIAKRSPKGTILGPRWCPRSAQDGLQPHMGNS